jgi:hypothetical protein
MTENSSDGEMFPMVRPRLRYTDAETLRRGRGFSYGEVSGSGASVQEMKMAGLPIDHLRRSVHDFNVKALQEILGKTGRGAATTRSKVKTRARSAEGKRQERAEKKRPKAEKKKDK